MPGEGVGTRCGSSRRDCRTSVFTTAGRLRVVSRLTKSLSYSSGPLMRRTLSLSVALALFASTDAPGQSFRGSAASLDRQNRVAREHGYTYLRNAAQVHRFVRAGYLVPVRESRAVVLHNVSFPYARQAVRTFVGRLGTQHRAACGQALVVTSLTRPKSHQPRNASRRSVHPTGMAIDLRIPRQRSCRAWLQRTLLSLERRGVLDVTRERRPAHYHVALFPRPYTRYLAQLRRSNGSRVYAVRAGDSLWSIARATGTTPNAIRKRNGLRSSRIYAGQILKVPAGG